MSQDPHLKITETPSRSGDTTVKLVHPAMGRIRVSRWSGNTKNRLFMSNVENHSGISIEISSATLTRDGSSEWVHSDRTILQVELSPAQWADLLTSLNTEGVPCTLRFNAAAEQPDVPKLPNLGTAMQHVESEFTKALAELELLNAEEMLGVREAISKLPAAKQTKVTDAFNAVVARVKRHLPYIRSRWEEAGTKTVEQFKQECATFVQGVLMRQGVNAANLPKLGDTLDNRGVLGMTDETLPHD